MSLIKKLRDFFSKPSARYSAGGLIAIGAIGALILWGGTSTMMSATSTTEFCISCHEINDNAYAEYQQTIHFQNSSGIKAECADCHIPHDFAGKIIRKIEASREIYGHLTGIIDTPEKYDAHRPAMAAKVWSEMHANDSANCRSCHINLEENVDLQYTWASNNHKRMATENLTCIDCHQGIAHKLPNTSRMSKSIPPVNP
ncbi:NapC/NirT family cytochrome c [Parendozoicomonas sp. Alg238-R29]|uniref:NapC/NirT family cytochrome c n=1 Tax=Parendozoicomonas sp. Alg238-R29 TaxID=2993446 RepID=UPI00248DD2EC|nr:NapC/NirT family cytochrome c [Parendozoicomonas sp. Alg238-R29]